MALKEFIGIDRITEIFGYIKDKLAPRDRDIAFYCTCSTAAATTKKIVTSSETPLYSSIENGTKICVRFASGNSASAPTISFNGNTAVAIKVYGSSGRETPTKWWTANDVVTFIYSNSYWIMQPTMTMTGGSYTAGDGIDITNDVISTDDMPAADIDEIITPLPGVTPKWMTYSTEEQAIGRWVDGKTIYQKVVVANTVWSITNSSSGQTVSELNGLNIDVPLKALAVNINATGADWIRACYPLFIFRKSNEDFKVFNPSTTSFKANRMIVEYTKTTD